MAEISKPDANPIVAALLAYFVLGLGHMIPNGSQKKFINSAILTIIGMVLCFLPGIIIGILSTVDAYQTAERLKKGEVLSDTEYTFPMYYKIAKMLDKTATCKNAPL